MISSSTPMFFSLLFPPHPHSCLLAHFHLLQGHHSVAFDSDIIRRRTFSFEKIFTAALDCTTCCTKRSLRPGVTASLPREGDAGRATRSSRASCSGLQPPSGRSYLPYPLAVAFLIDASSVDFVAVDSSPRPLQAGDGLGRLHPSMRLIKTATG